jgi:hypothetical protein
MVETAPEPELGGHRVTEEVRTADSEKFGLVVEKLVALSFLAFAGRFVAVNGFVGGTINGTFSSTNGNFWAVFRNLTTASIPHPSESVSPMLPNTDTAAQACKAKDKRESGSHIWSPNKLWRMITDI